MLTLSNATRIFVAIAPVDLRGSFNSLSRLAQQVLARLWVLAKRLERGRLSWPVSEQSSASLRAEELMALVCGLEVRAKANWYRR